MNNIYKTTLSLGAAALLLAAQASFANVVYKWVDDKGQTHFGQQPSEQYKSERVQTNTSRSFGQNMDYSDEASEPATAATTTTTDSVSETATEATEEVTEQAARVEKDASLCKKAQENKTMLLQHPIIRRNGKVMTVEEKNTELQYIEEVIRIHC